MWQHGLLFAACSTMGVSAPEPMIIGSAFPKEDKTSYLSKTLQVFTKSVAGERRTTSGGFSVVWDILALNHLPKEASDTGGDRGRWGGETANTDEIKKPGERTCGITRHRNQNFSMSSNFPRRGKPGKSPPPPPRETGGGVKRKCLFNPVRP